MTKNESNGAVTVVSNPADLDSTLLHFVLFQVNEGDVLHHSGFYGPRQGFAWFGGGRPRADAQYALYEAANGRLITICVPAVEGADRSLVDPIPWRRLITLGVPPVTGNAVRITGMGWARLAELNAAAPVLVSAA